MFSDDDSGSSLDLNSDIDSEGEQPVSNRDGGGVAGVGERAFFHREMEVDEVASEVSGGMENGGEEDMYLPVEYTDDQVFVDLFGATEMDAVDVGARVMEAEDYSAVGIEGGDGLYMNDLQGLHDVHFGDGRDVGRDGDTTKDGLCFGEKIEPFSRNSVDASVLYSEDDKLKQGLDGYLKLGIDPASSGIVEINEQQPDVFRGAPVDLLNENLPIIGEQHIVEGASHILDGSVEETKSYSEFKQRDVADMIGFDAVGCVDNEGYTAFSTEKKDLQVGDVTANSNEARDVEFCNAENANAIANSNDDNCSPCGGSTRGENIMRKDESACINLLDQPATLFAQKSTCHQSQLGQTESRAMAPQFLSLEVSLQEENSFGRSSDSKETIKVTGNEANDIVNVGSVGCVGIQAKKIAGGRTNGGVQDNGRLRYCLPLKEGDNFSAFDLVWGKTKSHPWWPGQIFDASCASEIAMKYEKKNCFLVEYFRDKTFAWCEPSQLRPFQKYFVELENQGNTEIFVKAVNDALSEVSRRVKLGLTSDLKICDANKVENAVVQEGTCNLLRDKCSIVNDFQPKNLVEFIQSIAQFPTGKVSRMDLVILKSQLTSFYITKGYYELPVFLTCGYCWEDTLAVTLCDAAKDSDHVLSSTQTQPSLILPINKKRGRKLKPDKEKNSLEDDINHEDLFKPVGGDRSSYHASGSTIVSLAEAASKACLKSSVKKRKSSNSDSSNAHHYNRKRGVILESTEPKSQPLTPNGSFKVGEWICRAASQITRSPPILEPCNATLQKTGSNLEKSVVDDFADEPSPYTTVENRGRRMVKSDYSFHLDELLSQLCLAARNPMKGYSFLSSVVNFFTRFKNSCCSYVKENHGAKVGRQKGRKRKLNSEDLSLPASSDTLAYDYMNDSFWSDMIFNSSAEFNEPKREGSQMQRPKKRRKPAEPLVDLGPNVIFETANEEEFTQKEKLELQRRKRRKLEPKKPLKHDVSTPNLKQERLAERPVIILDEKIVDECTPTELILNFNKPDSIPSEADLIKMFSRYGPLKEAETEVLKKNYCAKVVFKKRMDACRAFSSPGRFSIFGPTLVSYKLKCSLSRPEESLKTCIDSIGVASTSTLLKSPGFGSIQAQVVTGSVAIADQGDVKTGVMAAAVLDQADVPSVAADLGQTEAGEVVGSRPGEKDIRSLTNIKPVHRGKKAAKHVQQAVGVPDLAQAEISTFSAPAQLEIEALDVRGSAAAFSGEARESDSRNAEKLATDLAQCEKSAQLNGAGYTD